MVACTWTRGCCADCLRSRLEPCCVHPDLRPSGIIPSKGGDVVDEPAVREDERASTGGALGVTDQPPPSPGHEIVWVRAKEAFDEAYLGQVAKGLEDHGTVLMSLNGRDPYVDFLQEHADSLVYASQLYLEARTFVQLTVRAEHLLRRVVKEGTNQPYMLTVDLAGAIIDYVKEAQACLEKSGLSRSPSPTSSS
jgi:hypothetical protein